MTQVSDNELKALVSRIEVLEAEAEIRRIQARYMFLCDTPIPEYGVQSDDERIDLIMENITIINLVAQKGLLLSVSISKDFGKKTKTLSSC